MRRPYNQCPAYAHGTGGEASVNTLVDKINATPGLVKGSGGGRGTLSKSWLGSTRSSASVNLPPRMERTL